MSLYLDCCIRHSCQMLNFVSLHVSFTSNKDKVSVCLWPLYFVLTVFATGFNRRFLQVQNVDIHINKEHYISATERNFEPARIQKLIQWVQGRGAFEMNQNLKGLPSEAPTGCNHQKSTDLVSKTIVQMPDTASNKKDFSSMFTYE